MSKIRRVWHARWHSGSRLRPPASTSAAGSPKHGTEFTHGTHRVLAPLGDTLHRTCLMGLPIHDKCIGPLSRNAPPVPSVTVTAALASLYIINRLGHGLGRQPFMQLFPDQRHRC